MAENEVMEGTQVPFDATIPSSGMELLNVPQNADDDDDDELTTGQIILGTAIIGGLAIGVEHLSIFLWKKALVPAAGKISNWILKKDAKMEAEKAEKAAAKEKAAENVIEGKEVPQQKNK